jgi:hypothetical protein
MRLPAVPLSLPLGVGAAPQAPFQATYGRPPGMRAPRVRTRWWLVCGFALALGLAYVAGSLNAPVAAGDSATFASARIARS